MIFPKAQKAIADAKTTINTTAVVAGVALVLAIIALIVVIVK
jgi:hypothetical protein